MSDEPTRLIAGDAALDALTEGRRGMFRRKEKRPAEKTSSHCENCGTPLSGPYCSQCGQHAIDYRRSLGRVLLDAADSFLNWDTKFLRSLGVLLVSPWKLTNDFNAGRRARYVHPLRLYLLASIGFFLMLKFVTLSGTGSIQFRPEDRAEIANTLGKLTGRDSVLTPAQRAKVDSVRERLAASSAPVSAQEGDELQEIVTLALASQMKEKFERGDRAKLKAAVKKVRQIEAPLPAPPGPQDSASPSPPASAAPKPSGPQVFHFDAGQGKPRTPMETWFENRVKDKMGSDGSKSKLFLETLRNNIPTMMLCCIPLFALVLKLLYIRKRRYYVEHLVYALHIHSFVYLSVMIITLIGLEVAGVSNTARVLVTTALSLALLVHVFLSIRRVYGDGWIFTTLKFLFGGVAYAVILVFAVFITAVVTLLLPA